MASLLNEAELIGCNIYQDSTNHYQWKIEIPITKGKLLLEEQELGRWLLISNKIPQVWLKTEETLNFLRKLSEYRRISFPICPWGGKGVGNRWNYSFKKQLK